MEISVCESIKNLRKKYNISQETLADSLGITVQAISKWETGKAYPNIVLLPKIADYFHVSIDTLFQGGGGIGTVSDMLSDKAQMILGLNAAGWDCIGDSDWQGVALPEYGPCTASEDTLHLFGGLHNKALLEIACGDGRSLLYAARQGARELWGVDISAKQIEKARSLLREQKVRSQLFVSPMEVNPGIPFHYFDYVYSIYGIGWTMDLSKTIGLVSRYLKTNGIFIFSWDNPIVPCLAAESGRYVLARSYLSEPELTMQQSSHPLRLKNWKLSSYINCLAKHGMKVEKLLEQPHSLPDERHNGADGRIAYINRSMIIKARKL